MGGGGEPSYYDVKNENWHKWPNLFSLRKASSTLQTTDVRLVGLNRFESAVWGAFATGVTMAWHESSGVWEVWRDRIKCGRVLGLCGGTPGFEGFWKEPIRAGSLIGVEGFEGPLGF